MRCDFRNGPVVLVSAPIACIIPSSYAYLAAYLRQQGESVRMVLRNAATQAVVQRIMSADPVLVGFGSLYAELREIGDIIRMLDRAGRRFPVVVGGQMVSPIPEFAVRISGADFGAIGESEIVLHQLVRALREGRDPATVNGLAVRDVDRIEFTGLGETILDLSELPPVPYELFPDMGRSNVGRWHADPHQSLWRAEDKVINVHGGRGCPFSCNFCYHDGRARYRPIGAMMDEAGDALARFNGNMLYFSDNLGMPSPSRARELVAGIGSLGRRVEWSISSRFGVLSRIDNALLADMRAAGCRTIGLGAESGSDRILRVIGKRCVTDQIRDGIRRLTAAGIIPTATIQFGQHTETMDDAEASIRLIRECLAMSPNMQWNFTLTTPFPGSSLYDMLLSDGRIRDHGEFYSRYFGTSRPGAWRQVVNVSAMTDQQVLDMRDRAWGIYMEHKARVSDKDINQPC